MKKTFNYILGILAFGAAATFTACSTDNYGECWNDDFEVTTPEEANTVFVKSNVDGYVTVNGENYPVKAGEETAINVKGDHATVAVHGEGFETQTYELDFDDHVAYHLDATLVKKPQSNVKVEDATAKAEDVIVKAEDNKSHMLIPANTTINGVDPSAHFGIITYVPAVADIEYPETVGQEVVTHVPTPATVAVCEPSGATFDQPVTITVPIEVGAEGTDLVCVNDKEVVKASDNSTNISAEVNHFSDWVFSFNNLKTTLVKAYSEEVYNKNMFLEAGTKVINVKRKIGYSSSIKEGTLIDRFHEATFNGKLRTVETPVEFTIKGSGNARITLYQEVKVYRIVCGNASWTVTVWGEVSGKVTKPEEHSGGAGSN